jgi:beta-carotene 3-hydroxylase
LKPFNIACSSNAFATLAVSFLMNLWVSATIVLGTVVALEGLAWVVHRYLLHGPLWFLHRTHHEPQRGWFEANDLIALVYGVLSAVAVIWGDLHGHWVREVGFGIAAYGVLYFLLHDVVVHQRVRMPGWLRSYVQRDQGYLRRLVRAHKVHHKVITREGSQAFGFLYAQRKFER